MNRLSCLLAGLVLSGSVMATPNINIFDCTMKNEDTVKLERYENTVYWEFFEKSKNQTHILEDNVKNVIFSISTGADNDLITKTLAFSNPPYIYEMNKEDNGERIVHTVVVHMDDKVINSATCRVGTDMYDIDMLMSNMGKQD